MNSEQLLNQIYYCAQLLPPPTLDAVLDILTQSEIVELDKLKTEIVAQVPNPKFRRAVTDLLTLSASEKYSYQALAAALSSAAYAITKTRQSLIVDLVWTGPECCGLPIRQTAQVLLELINNTQQELTLISFAVYKIPAIAQALTDALKRGVSLRLIAETPSSGEGKISFSLTQTLGKNILENAQVFIWPKEQRPVDTQGRYGSLHIKAALADREHLFITSANLTDYALSLNMELGVLIQNKILAHQINNQFEQLILNGILIPLKKI